jgi:DNA-binding SARP family transcriptional activator
MSLVEAMAEQAVALIERSELGQGAARLEDLLAALDAVRECQLRHQHAYQVLQEATRQFEQVDAEWQAQLGSLHGHLLLLVEALQLHSRPHTARSPQPGRGSPHPLGAHPGVRVALSPLSITCFGQFQVTRADRPVQLCRNRNGRTILRYLVAQPRHRATLDELMETIWPADPPGVARHKLHCAFSALRRSLNDGHVSAKGGGYLLCRNGTYMINPAATLHIDAEEFLAEYQTGQRTGGSAAVDHYQAACRLYTGPFMVEDLYADWSLFQREQLLQAYLAMCQIIADHHLAGSRFDEAIRWATKALQANRCEEAAYQQLMRGHVGAGRRDEALRQYHRCQQVLAEDLGVQPMDCTMAIYHAILGGGAGPAPLGAAGGPARNGGYSGWRRAGVEPVQQRG